MTTDAVSMAGNRIAMLVTAFWPDKPALWFAQLDGLFRTNGITDDESKFWHVVSNLDNAHAAEVEDVITNPPAEGKYLRLKEELIKRLSASREQRIRQLIEREEMGDRKPAQFLRHLRSLAGTSVPNEFLRALRIARLPAHLPPILTTQEGMPLDKLAELADRVFEVTPRPQVATASASDPLMATLLQRVEDLTRQVAALSAACDARSRSRGRSRGSSRRSSRNSSPHSTDDRLCWYHRRFGARASKCREPCSYRPSPHENP
ncbi:uncharacterized protein LOC124174189 [Ischnura elegans]|uniref:uncharacterized protein LOC124174189 n=1 Tax=Ischnura elegans TaxID=197161 RepID=UPI001ED8BFDE|nr:uncharacterized protein LOC124174189 [Ischnura elegans]